MHGHRDLVAWQKAMDLVVEIYAVTKSFPRDEMYGLTSQMRRAAVSVPSNLAEGHGRNSTKEFHQFIGHARGSLLELETQVELSRRVGYIKPVSADRVLKEIDEMARIITGLRTWAASAGSES